MLRTQKQRGIFSMIVFLLLFFGAIALINWMLALVFMCFVLALALMVFLICRWAEWVNNGDYK